MSTAPAAASMGADPSARVFKTPSFARQLVSKKVAAVCLIWLAIVVAVAILAPILMPDIAKQNAGEGLNVNQGPSWEHILGTDTLGRDVFDRILVGTRITLIGVLQTVLRRLLNESRKPVGV